MMQLVEAGTPQADVPAQMGVSRATVAKCRLRRGSSVRSASGGVCFGEC